MTTPTRKPKSVLLIVVVVVCVLGALSLCILPAIAIPAFISYVRRAKTAEVGGNIRSIQSGIETYALSESLDPASGQLHPHGLPPSLPLTPATQGTERRLWPRDAPPGWAEIGFALSDPLYFSYEVVTDSTAGTVIVRAVGDLDGDGTTSEFLTHGRLDATTGAITWDPALTVTNELE